MNTLSRLASACLAGLLLGAAGAPDCPATADAVGRADHLVHTRQGLAQNHLSVLAVGSGMFTASPPGRRMETLLNQMLATLKTNRPDLTVDVTVRGYRGLSAARMLPILQTEVKPGRYQLVIWQTGTVEAVQNIAPSQFYETLIAGTDQVQGAGADLLLVNPQYSRILEARTDLNTYNETLRQAAMLPGIALFDRFLVTEDWADGDEIDLDRATPGARGKLKEQLRRCLGRLLASTVLEMAK